MGAAFCPNRNSKEYLELIDIFKDSGYVHKLYKLNNGNPIEFDHKGDPSILFEDLLAINDGDRVEALRMKATVFNDSFIEFFGKWYEGDFKPETHDVYENGEPFMDTFLDYTYEEDQKNIHPDSTIRADIRKYGVDEITDINNSYVWAIEKEYGLIDEKGWKIVPNRPWKVKKLKGFTFDKAIKIINKLAEKGIHAYPVEVFDPKIDKFPKTGVQVRVDIGRPAPKKASSFKNGTGKIVLAGESFDVRYADTKPIKDHFAQIERGNGLGTMHAAKFLQYLKDAHPGLIDRNSTLSNMINLLLNNRKKFETLKIKTFNRSTDGETYMEYDPNTHTINLYTEDIISEPTMIGFISTFVHEMGHAAVYDAIDNPESEIDKQLKKTLTEAWEVYKNDKTRTNENAAKDVHEFTANFFTDARLRNQLKEMREPGTTHSLYKRVLNAIINWFRRIAGYKLIKEHEGNLNDYLEKTITNFLNSKTEIRNESRVTSVIKKAEMKRDFLVDIHNIINVEDHNTIKKAIVAYSNLFKRDDDTHTYQFKADPSILFKSVTQINAEYGYGISPEYMQKLRESTDSDDLKKRLRIERGGNIGTSTHKAVDNVVKDVEEDTGVYNLSDDATETIKIIIDGIKKEKTYNGQAPIILSEVTVADVSKGIAGTIDLVVIDALGRIYIYDFKTHEKGFQFYDSTLKKKKSDQDNYRLQLSAYKLLLEEALGGKVRVAGMSVIMLQPVIDDTNHQIVTLSSDQTWSRTGMDSFYITPLSLQTVYGTGKGYRWDSVAQKAALDTDVLTTPGYKIEQIEASKMSTIEGIYRETMKMLESKSEIMRKRYSFTKRREFEEHFNLVSQMNNPTEAIIEIIKYAAKVTNALSKRYNEMEKKGLIFTPAMLQEWRDYIMAYEPLDNLQSLLATDPKLLNNPEVNKVLAKVIENKNKIKFAYTLKGKEAVARRLVPYFDMIRVQRKEELESFWRRLEYRVKYKIAFKEGETIAGKTVTGTMTPEEFEKYGKTMKEFTDYHLSKEQNDIDKATYELLLKELSVASNDVNEAIRWIDALVDTKDPVAAAIVKAFNLAEEDSRLQAIDKQIEIYNVLIELEKKRSKTVSTSEKKFYDEILDITNFGNYLIRPYLVDLEIAEREVRSKHRNDESGSFLSSWINANFPLQTYKEEYLEDLHKYLIEQYKLKNLKAAEVNAIMENETHANKGFPLSTLARESVDEDGNKTAPQISIEAADIAINWKARNRKLYSDVIEKWNNPKWNKFMDRLGISTKGSIKEQFDALAKSNDPMAKMYTLLVNMAEEADSGIPYSHRIGFRLPGVYKNMNENIREGNSIASTFKERLQVDFIRRKGDVQYNQQEYTDEAGNPKYFLPIHFNNKLSEEQQSFDLPTIYFKYWDSANDYANKRDILPTIEMAKYFIENRSVEKRNAMGEKILRTLKSTIPGFENEAAVTKNSALVKQLEDWFQMYVYGNTSERSEIKISDDLTLDLQKLVDGINRYTSVNLLALNVVQSFANVAVGETMQAIEAIAGEYVTKKSYTKGAYYYSKWMPGMLGDIGERVKSSLGSLLIQQFNAMNEDLVGETQFANLNKAKMLAREQAFAFMQQGGEHLLRGRFLFAMLENEIRAINSAGEDIGSMIEYYYVKDGKLAIKDEVDLVKSKWTEEDQKKWGMRFRGIADRVHGAYSLEARVAAQRYFLGKLAYMFRKFVMPGIKRRYGKRAYSERLQQTTEGNYITTFKFFSKLYKEILGMQFALVGEEWAALSPHEKANIKRTISELAVLTSLMVLSTFAYSHWADGEDETDKRFWAFLAYQSLRLKTEMSFYVSPGSAMQILRSPMASMSVLENIGKTWDQLFNPMERYERGPWKGHLKLTRDVIQFVPIYKQYYKLRDVEEQIPWFR